MKIKLLVTITALAAVLRFYNITTNPPGLYLDEISYGYNAYSILKTAKDEYGNFLPAVLKSYGDYKPPLYSYLLVPTIAVFGLNEFAVRFPSALLGTLTVIFIYLLTNKLLKQEKVSILSSFFLAISPWHLQFSRAGFEANVMLFFLVLATTTLAYSKARLNYLAISAISFGLAFNTYHGARIWIPLFFAILLYTYRKYILRKKKALWIFFLLFAIFTIPFITNFSDYTTRARGVTILGQENLFNVFVKNYLSHFSPTFLFFKGDTIGRHSVLGIGELFIAQIPFLLIGLVALVKKPANSKLILAWLIISPIPAAIAQPAPHALRSIALAPALGIATALGLVTFFAKKMSPKMKILAISVISVVLAYNITTYTHLYHVHYPREKAVDWSVGLKEMVFYVEGVKNNYDRIFITQDYGIPYIYFLFYTKYPPEKYQRELGSSEGFSKYVFYKGGWIGQAGNHLIVTDYGGHPRNLQKEIFINDNNLIYRVGE